MIISTHNRHLMPNKTTQRICTLISVVFLQKTRVQVLISSKRKTSMLILVAFRLQ